ncbi:MAG: hypothetical protein RLP44_25115 [Aggregatilineales bacterium]
MKRNPTILFIGTEDSADSLRANNEGWTIFHPQETMEALAWYTFYFPELVIIEDAPESEDAHEVYAHLRSIYAENVLLLSDEPFRWVDDSYEPYSLPLSASVRDIGLAVSAWDTPEFNTILRGALST